MRLRPAMIRVPGTIAFERARTAAGTFAPESGEGPDPAAMNKAYGPPAQAPAAGNLSGRGKGAAIGLGVSVAALLASRRWKSRTGLT